MSKFLTLSFWTSNAYYAASGITWAFWSVFGAVVLVAIVSRLVLYFKKKALLPWQGRLLRKVYKCFSTMGIIGLALMFFNYEDIPLLGARLFYGLWLVGMAVWIVYIIVHVLKRLPQDRLAGSQMENVDQYLSGR